ncbi:MAG: hypothetical protein C4336_00640 [Armatimonadota bacterium]
MLVQPKLGAPNPNAIRRFHMQRANPLDQPLTQFERVQGAQDTAQGALPNGNPCGRIARLKESQAHLQAEQQFSE